MLQEGFTILVIGMTTVVAFLLMLVGLIHLMGCFVAAFIPPSQPPASIASTAEEETLAVAIAAARRARG